MTTRVLPLLAVIVVAAGCGLGGGGTATAEPSRNWAVASPAAERIDGRRLERAVARIEREHPNLVALVVARNGRLVFERYRGGYGATDAVHTYSVTKSFLSALVGIALRRGELRSVDQRLVEFMAPKLAPDADPRVLRITLRHLLTMTAGYAGDAAAGATEGLGDSTDWMRTIVNRPLVDQPGRAFRYDTASTHLLSGVLSRVTGLPASEYARRHLFAPLGIPAPQEWPADAQGHTFGGAGLALPPRSLAKLGQLYLDGGSWGGKRILPASYVRASTRTQVGLGRPGRGYGYLWWTREHPRGRIFAALGHGGQAIVVVPKLDLVVVLAAEPGPRELDVSRVLLDLVLPAVRD